MRCWKTPRGTFLVEAPDLPRMTNHDVLTRGQERRLAREAKRWAEEHGHGRLGTFHRYYELEQSGAVKLFYEEYAYSDEDDLYAWSYLVLDDQLWEFRLCEYDEREPVLQVSTRIRGLLASELPNGTRIVG